MVAWPGTLPQSPLLDGYTEQGEEQVLRTAIDVGPDKLRKRATAVVTNVKFNMIMDSSQLSTLENFYDNTLNGGTGVVDFTDPISNTTKQYRFIERYTFSAIGEGLYRVTLNWERLP